MENESLLSRLQDIETYLKDSSSNNKDMDKKIQFFERLLIEKDNNIHAQNKKIKENVS